MAIKRLSRADEPAPAKQPNQDYLAAKRRRATTYVGGLRVGLPSGCGATVFPRPVEICSVSLSGTDRGALVSVIKEGTMASCPKVRLRALPF
jgi:hypothetical protein